MILSVERYCVTGDRVSPAKQAALGAIGLPTEIHRDEGLLNEFLKIVRRGADLIR